MHRFWSKQPVRSEGVSLLDRVGDGPVPLPSSFVWETIHLDTNFDAFCDFLNQNYEGVNAGERFKKRIDRNYLLWTFLHEDQPDDWIACIRHEPTGSIVGSICVWPWNIRVGFDIHPTVQGGFLCVHPSLRKKDFAPLLLQEIIRRFALRGYKRAVCTSVYENPGHVTTLQRYLRPLCAEPLVRSGFWQIAPPMTISRMQRLHRLPEKELEEFSSLQRDDVPGFVAFLNHVWSSYTIAPVATEKWVEHVFLSPRSPVHCRVRRSTSGKVTDFWSYIPHEMTVLDTTSRVSSFWIAEAYYVHATTVSLEDVFLDAMVHAKTRGCALWSQLNLMESEKLEDKLRLTRTSARSNLLFYNWGSIEPMDPRDVAVVCW